MNKMKTEIINHPTKGLCILISNIDPNAFLINNKIENSIDIEKLGGLTNVEIIASYLQAGRRISAIREILDQTEWDLKKQRNI